MIEDGFFAEVVVNTKDPRSTAWMPALKQHQACFGQAPEMATGDRGSFSAQNEREAEALGVKGVKKVALPPARQRSARRNQRCFCCWVPKFTGFRPPN
jgi:hypothetical protein